MVEELYRALLNHRAMSTHKRPEDYAFASSSGRPMNPDTLPEVLQAALAKWRSSSINLGPMACSCYGIPSGSLIYRRTADVKLAQEWLGHSSSRITMDTYIHLMKDTQKQTAEAVFTRPRAVAPEQQN